MPDGFTAYLEHTAWFSPTKPMVAPCSRDAATASGITALREACLVFHLFLETHDTESRGSWTPLSKRSIAHVFSRGRVAHFVNRLLLVYHALELVDIVRWYSVPLFDQLAVKPF